MKPLKMVDFGWANDSLDWRAFNDMLLATHTLHFVALPHLARAEDMITWTKTVEIG